jgi:hypothetical protein
MEFGRIEAQGSVEVGLGLLKGAALLENSSEI